MGGRRLGVADMTGGPGVITYREAVAEGLARELRRDPSVVCLGEDIGAAGGVFKTQAGLFDVVGMMAAAIRSDDPVVFFEHKGLFASKGPAAPDGHVVELGKAAVVRPGTDVSLVALAATVPMALA